MRGPFYHPRTYGRVEVYGIMAGRYIRERLRSIAILKRFVPIIVYRIIYRVLLSIYTVDTFIIYCTKYEKI